MGLEETAIVEEDCIKEMIRSWDLNDWMYENSL